jgi:hypothetical protein
MDPVTLFALANGAVSAVKAGCKLYKDIKGAAGDVKDVIQDLDAQFHKLYDGKPGGAPPAAVKQLNEEKARVKNLNKRTDETTNIYQEIGNHLGVYYDNYHKCMAVFEEEEKRAHTQVYTGDDSIGKRALQRVLMRKQLEAMSKELREIMVYQCPAELGALYTEVEAMMKEMGKEQKGLVARQMQDQARDERRRRARLKKLNEQFVISIVMLVFVFTLMYMFAYVINLRMEKYPDLGNCTFPKGSVMYEKWTKTVWANCK